MSVDVVRASASRPRLSSVVALVVAGLLLVVGGCAGDGPTAAPGTGIRGTVTLGPTCPVERVGEPPCVEPYEADLVVTSAEDDAVVARVRSAADGTFSVDVPAGDYVIVPAPGGDPFPAGAPVNVTVVQGAYSQVDVAYDTGIR